MRGHRPVGAFRGGRTGRHCRAPHRRLVPFPRVESTAAGLCTIDLAGKAATAHLPHSRAAVEQLQSLGLEAAAGVARTPFLALMAARLAGIVAGLAEAGPGSATRATRPAHRTSAVRRSVVGRDTAIPPYIRLNRCREKDTSSRWRDERGFFRPCRSPWPILRPTSPPFSQAGASARSAH